MAAEVPAHAPLRRNYNLTAGLSFSAGHAGRVGWPEGERENMQRLAMLRRSGLRRLAGFAAGCLLLGCWAAAAKETPSPIQKELEGKSPKESQVYLKQIVDDGKGSKEIYFYLGNAYYETGDIPGAITAFLQAVQIDSLYFKAMFNLALMYDEGENYIRAIETFERAARIEPSTPDVWSHMGNSYYAIGQHAKAMDLYRKAVSMDSTATHAYYSMGIAFADAGIFREAARYWGRVSQLEPDSQLGQNAAENVKLLQQYLIPH